MKHKDEISICKTCDKTVSESHPLFSQRMKNPDHNVVKYLPSSSVKELVEALGDISKIIPERDCYSDIDLFRKAVSMAKAAMKQFEED